MTMKKRTEKEKKLQWPTHWTHWSAYVCVCVCVCVCVGGVCVVSVVFVGSLVYVV